MRRVCGEVNSARPANMCAPVAAVAAYESAGAICARSRRIRAITAPKSSETGPPISTPSSALRRTSLRARAERRSALDGTQPTLRQSPPAKCFSTSADLAPRRAACLAEMRPPAPAPIATRS
jgi:hypothetical protein